MLAFGFVPLGTRSPLDRRRAAQPRVGGSESPKSVRNSRAPRIVPRARLPGGAIDRPLPAHVIVPPAPPAAARSRLLVSASPRRPRRVHRASRRRRLDPLVVVFVDIRRGRRRPPRPRPSAPYARRTVTVQIERQRASGRTVRGPSPSFPRPSRVAVVVARPTYHRRFLALELGTRAAPASDATSRRRPPRARARGVPHDLELVARGTRATDVAETRRELARDARRHADAARAPCARVRGTPRARSARASARANARGAVRDDGDEGDADGYWSNGESNFLPRRAAASRWPFCRSRCF